jgi:hypothetical protein
LKGNLNDAFNKQVFNMPQAQWKSMVQPNCVGDDFSGKPVTFVTVNCNIPERAFGHTRVEQGIP